MSCQSASAEGGYEFHPCRDLASFKRLWAVQIMAHSALI